MNVQAVHPILEPRAGERYTLPGHYYTDPEIFEREKEHIFYRTWQFAGHVSRFPKVGSYLSVDLLDESLLFLRGADDEIRGFYNVCQHRAHQLLEGKGCTPSIVCPYHGWRYRLDGGLEYARNAEQVDGFDTNDIRLSPIRTERFLDFIFFNLDPEAASFSSQVPGLEAEIRERVPALDELLPRDDAGGLGHTTLNCNWKVLVDNCVECYHCEASHPAFADLVDLDGYEIVAHRMHTSHTARSENPDNAAYRFSPEQAAGAFAFWHVWPNLTFGRFPGSPNFSVFSADPIDLVRTRSRGDQLYLPNADSPQDVARREYIAQTLFPEDVAICESVQRGLGSRGYRPGRMMVTGDSSGRSESVAHLFQRLTLAALEAGTADG